MGLRDTRGCMCVYVWLYVCVCGLVFPGKCAFVYVHMHVCMSHGAFALHPGCPTIPLVRMPLYPHPRTHVTAGMGLRDTCGRMCVNVWVCANVYVYAYFCGIVFSGKCALRLCMCTCVYVARLPCSPPRGPCRTSCGCALAFALAHSRHCGHGFALQFVC